MRVAYRRDDIKLRNRSFYTKPLVEYLRLFLVRGRARIEHFYGGHDFLPSLHTGVDNYGFTIKHDIACNYLPYLQKYKLYL